MPHFLFPSLDAIREYMQTMHEEIVRISNEVMSSEHASQRNKTSILTIIEKFINVCSTCRDQCAWVPSIWNQQREATHSKSFKQTNWNLLNIVQSLYFYYTKINWIIHYNWENINFKFILPIHFTGYSRDIFWRRTAQKCLFLLLKTPCWDNSASSIQIILFRKLSISWIFKMISSLNFLFPSRALGSKVHCYELEGWLWFTMKSVERTFALMKYQLKLTYLNIEHVLRNISKYLFGYLNFQSMLFVSNMVLYHLHVQGNCFWCSGISEVNQDISHWMCDN